MKFNIKWKDLISIMAGDLLLAFAIVTLLEPNRLVTGGVTGVAIIIADYTGRLGFSFPLWATNLALNIPLFWLGMKMMGKDFLIKTAFATLFLSAALYVASFLPAVTDDPLLSALFGGVFSGIGLGLVFRASATTGGSDLAASILHHHVIKHHSIARILFVIDSVIISAGFLAFGPSAALYAVITVFVSSKATDTLLEGLNFSKAAFVISDKADEIAGEILQHLERGVTGLDGRGMFTGKERNVLLCVVSAKELVMLKTIVHSVDIGAFVIVADVREVLGEGFGEAARMR
ncbi:MAG: YitT family protein [Clostridiales bacterium]|nr:YitT family protein [Clostridiales bacterium]